MALARTLLRLLRENSVNIRHQASTLSFVYAYDKPLYTASHDNIVLVLRCYYSYKRIY